MTTQIVLHIIQLYIIVYVVNCNQLINNNYNLLHVKQNNMLLYATVVA